MDNTITDSQILDISHIAGNASDDIKRTVGDPADFFQNRRPHGVLSPIFGESIAKRLKVKEVSLCKKPEEERKLEAKVVLEIEVAEDMLNGGGTIHGGCSAFLVDICSALALTALGMEVSGDVYWSASQSLNIVYHSPAHAGSRLRLVNTTLTLGARVQSARTEIWNATHHRLVASGTHIKMLPSKL